MGAPAANSPLGTFVGVVDEALEIISVEVEVVWVDEAVSDVEVAVLVELSDEATNKNATVVEADRVPVEAKYFVIPPTFEVAVVVATPLDRVVDVEVTDPTSDERLITVELSEVTGLPNLS